MSKLTPLHNYMCIEPIEQKKKAEVANLILTDQTVGLPKWATIRSIGAGVPDMSGFKFRSTLQEGDLVYMHPYAVEECDLSDIDGTKSYFVGEGDILMVEDESSSIGFKPLGNWIVISIEEEEEKITAGGIYLPQVAKVKPQFATVIATGPGLRTPGAQVSAAMDMIYSALCENLLIDPTDEKKAYEIFKYYTENNIAVVPPTVSVGDTVIIRKNSAIAIDMSTILGVTELEYITNKMGTYYLIPEGDIYSIVDLE